MKPGSAFAIKILAGWRSSRPADLSRRPKWLPYKGVLAAIVLVESMFFGACKTAGPGPEQVRQEPAKTVYKSADEDAADAPAVVPPRQKVPGE
jgi:hypothetical protein